MKSSTLFLENFNPAFAVTDQKELRAEGAMEAFEVIGARGQEAIHELGTLAIDPKVSRIVAERAVPALGYIGQDALPTLLAVLRSHQRGSVRASAAKTIENLGTNAIPAVPVLLHCVRDEEDAVAVIASDTLSTLRVDPALIVPVWADCLQDSRFYVRQRAMLYLEHLGMTARFAVPALVPLLHDNDRFVRAGAINALQQIDPDALKSQGGE